MTGRFISFEGIDGAGKTTHIGAVAERLRAGGACVVETREPGGTPLAERLRELLLHDGMDALTETLLMFAARRDHVGRVIVPALARGDTVLCDRFTDATFAYQGGGRGLDAALLGTLEHWVHGPLQPDLTLWFDAPAATAALRRAGARSPDRFERQDQAFFARVRDGYRARMTAAPQRFARIDAALPRDAVAQQIDAVLAQRGWGTPTASCRCRGWPRRCARHWPRSAATPSCLQGPAGVGQFTLALALAQAWLL